MTCSHHNCQLQDRILKKNQISKTVGRERGGKRKGGGGER